VAGERRIATLARTTKGGGEEEKEEAIRRDADRRVKSVCDGHLPRIGLMLVSLSGCRRQGRPSLNWPLTSWTKMAVVDIVAAAAAGLTTGAKGTTDSRISNAYSHL
jgi:hypothetical protein